MARMLDPRGFALPVTVRERMFIQSLWQQGLTWEKIATEKLVKEFGALRQEMEFLSTFSIPRPFLEKVAYTHHLLGFCDSSLKAYCTVVYI